MLKKTIIFLIIIGFPFTVPSFADDSEEQQNSYILGKNLYDQKKYKEAYPHLQKAAGMGNADAMMHLGKMFYNGWGVEHDHEKAVEWHEKAAAAGNKESAEKLKKMKRHH